MYVAIDNMVINHGQQMYVAIDNLVINHGQQMYVAMATFSRQICRI